MKRCLTMQTGRFMNYVAISQGKDIGSTTQLLERRKRDHKSDYKNKKYKNLSSGEIIEGGNYYIKLLKDCSHCSTKKELEAEERCYIETMECVNKQVPGQTEKEYRKRPEVVAKNVRTFCGCGGHFFPKHKNKHLKSQLHKKTYPDSNGSTFESVTPITEKQKRMYGEKESCSEEVPERVFLKDHKTFWINENGEKECLCGSILVSGDLKKHLNATKHKNFKNNNQHLFKEEDDKSDNNETKSNKIMSIKKEIVIPQIQQREHIYPVKVDGKFVCPCGSEVKGHVTRHIYTDKHIAYEDKVSGK